MKPIINILTTTALAGLMALPAIAEPGVTDTEITIGNVLPMNSSAALPARASHFGTVVAAAEWNEMGGVNGRKIIIKTEDDGYIPANTVQSLRKLMDEGVFGLLGSGAGAGTAAILPILEEEGIPTIVNFSPVQAAIDPIKPTIFMLGAAYQDLIYAQLKWILENKQPEGAKLGIIRQDDDFGAQLEEAFDRAVDETGVDHAEAIRYKRGQKAFGAEMLKIRAAGVNVMVAGGVTTEIPAMAKEAQKFGLPLFMAAVPTSSLPPIVNLMKPYGYTYYSGDYVAPMGSEGAAHFEAMADKFLDAGDIDALNRYSLAGYAAAMMMIGAIDRCGDDVTRTCVVGKLTSGEGFDTNGATGSLSFTDDRHITATAVSVLEIDPEANTLTPVTDFIEY